MAFQPVRDRAQRFANRLVYGKRATPYEVLAEFSERMAGTYATEDVLPRMARILAEGTGASARGRVAPRRRSSSASACVMAERTPSRSSPSTPSRAPPMSV